MRKLLVCSVVLALTGCAKPTGVATPLVSPTTVPSDPLTAALAAPSRTPTNIARDPARHPKETLAFFGVTPSSTVVELWPGRGWYTEVLAPLLRDQGKLIVAAPTGDYLQPYKDFLKEKPAVYDKVELLEVTPPDISFGPDGSADAVLTFRNLHGWVQQGHVDQVFAAAFRVLKPGGVFGIEEHRAPAGTAPDASAKTGYISEDAAIAYAQKAGLVLDARSEINANPQDTKDYANGVWALPPTLRGGDVDKAKYVAIGESDRMTLRFKKPAQ